MKKTCAFILVAIFLMTGCNAETSSPVLMRKDILADYDYLISMIGDNYPFLNVNKRLNGVDWLQEAEVYRASAPNTASHTQVVSWFQDLIAKLHNGHATVVGSQAEYQYLVNLYGNKKEAQPWAELLSDPSVQNTYGILGNKTSGLPKKVDVQKSSFMVSFLDDQTAYINIPSFSEKFIPNEMKALSAFLPTVKEVSRLIIDIRDNSGGSDAYWQQLVQRIIPEPIRWRYYNLLRGTYIKPFIEAKTGAPFERISQLNELPEKVSSALPEDVIRDFSRFFPASVHLKPENSIQFKGRIYLIVSPKVFSSSEKFVSFAKSTGWATLVGERTGGDGLGADPVLVKPPHSHLIVRLPLIMGVTEQGVINEEKKTEPDIWADTTKNPILVEDHAVRAILDHR